MALFAKDESLGLSEDESGENPNDLLDDENFGCGRMQPLPEPKYLKPGDRLTLRRRGQLDRIHEIVRRPPRTLPPLHLPAWPYMSLDQKLPVVKSLKGTLFYARGTVGQPLYQTPKAYSNDDPFNQVRVIPEPYNALHDPHAQAYLQKPGIRKFLMKQGLITKTGQVLCSVKDFNKYRAYLNTLYTEDIHKVMEDADGHHESTRKMDAELTKYLTKTEGDLFQRMARMRKRKRQLEVEKLERITMKQKMEDDRQFRLRTDRELDRKKRQMRAATLEAMRKEKLQKSRLAEKIKKERVMHNLTVKEHLTKERIAYDKELVGQAYRQFVLEWMDTKWLAQEEKIEKTEILEKSLEVKLKEKAELRQRHMENYRAALPQILEKQRAKQERLMNIVRKYFFRWLNNVRKRKARKPDANHQSLWDTSVVVDETLKYLRKESGYEKLDDFILSILKLKRDIKAEIANEEAEEAARARADEDEEEYEEGEEEMPVQSRPPSSRPVTATATEE